MIFCQFWVLHGIVNYAISNMLGGRKPLIILKSGFSGQNYFDKIQYMKNASTTRLHQVHGTNVNVIKIIKIRIMIDKSEHP